MWEMVTCNYAGEAELVISWLWDMMTCGIMLDMAGGMEYPWNYSLELFHVGSGRDTGWIGCLYGGSVVGMYMK